MTLTKIISGGQSGTDLAALIVAKLWGLETGGTAPKGFRTTSGTEPVLLGSVFGLKQHSSRDYPPRTKNNIRDSDCTLIVAEDLTSPGEVLTLKLCKELSKPTIIAELDRDPRYYATLLKRWKTKTLNIAGNSEKTVPGMTYIAITFLNSVFDQYFND